MLVIEAKLKGTTTQYSKLDEAIRTGQFIRNTCLRYWEANIGVTRNDLQKLCSVLAKNKETPWAKKLNSQARQAQADRAWSAIQRFYENCRLEKPGKKGYPKDKKFSRSVEYKNSGWKLSYDRRQITFTDGFKVGTMDLWSSRDLVCYAEKQISRVRVIRRADGYYAQFLLDWDRREKHEFKGKMTVIDLGLKEFYTDSDGNTVENPKYLRKSERRIKMLQRRVSKKHIKGKKQSNRYQKARQALALANLKISRQREDRARKEALALVKSNDLIVYEDLKIQNMVKNHHLAKSISDASWYQFTQWLQYFAKVHGVIVIAVPPHNTTVDCSCCQAKVKKTLSTRTHKCSACGTVLDRDHNAAKNILAKGFKLLAEYLNSTVGHTESGAKSSKAQGETNLWLKNGDVLALSWLDELRTKNSWESPSRFGTPN
ncbi:RNA-guided endonuclease InsQ/TnpB family protein [Capilliphycus salinus ALCB114379]|uniref:RNA-guided endonuclease InsQ/TnpB family protein n=1 Tax=Capilliphycus salinus TaxID=2768948 RepID=UPI0039A4409B